MDANQLILEDYLDKHPYSVSQTLSAMPASEVAEFIESLPLAKSLALFELMNSTEAARYFGHLKTDVAKALLEQGDFSFAESVLRQLDGPLRESLLASLSEERAAIIRRKLQQEPNTVGLLMVPAIVVNKEMTVKGAIEIIRRNNENMESYLYVVDLNGAFEGAVRLKELLWADRNKTLGELMITAIPRFQPETPIKEVLNHPAWYEYRYIPVVDKTNTLLGTLPYRTTREINPKGGSPSTKDIIETGTALGELYLIGLTGLLQSVGK